MKKLLTAVLAVLLLTAGTASAQSKTTLESLFSQVKSIADVIASLTQSTSQVAQVSGAGSASNPTYSPIYAENFDTGTPGNTPTEFAFPTTPAKTLYSTQIGGPFGGGVVVRQENQTGNKSFGGRIMNLPQQLGEGDEIWVRWYEYFPAGFKFANGTNGDGGSGGIKWMRFQGTDVGGGGGPRLTFQPYATPNCTSPCSGGLGTFTPSKVTGENVGWLLYEGRQNPAHAHFSSAVSYQTGQWLAVQAYLRLSKGDVPHGDGNGLIRVWIDGTLVEEFQRNTLPPAGHTQDGSLLQSIWWGNYWNGGFPQNQHWYFDEAIITTQQPNTTDSGGRPFIHPQTKVSDFGGGGGSTQTPTSCSYTYSWGSCQSNGTQTGTVTGSSPSGCVGTPVTSRSCTYVPPVTAPPSGQGVFFQDDFESGNLSHTENGARWTGSSWISVNKTNPAGGQYSLEFSYPARGDGGDGFSEQRFALGNKYPDLWVSYDIFIPSNYYHRRQSTIGHGSDNNKGYIMLWEGGDNNYSSPDGPQLSSHFWPNGDGSSRHTMTTFKPGYFAGGHGNCAADAITLSDRGQWITITTHAKYSSSQGAKDGAFEIWKTYSDGTTVKTCDFQNRSWYVPGQGGFDTGYLLGWANSGFAQQTKFYIDNVTFSGSPLSVGGTTPPPTTSTPTPEGEGGETGPAPEEGGEGETTNEEEPAEEESTTEEESTNDDETTTTEEPEEESESDEPTTSEEEDTTSEPIYQPTTTQTPTYTFTRSLKQGDKGEDVRTLQKFLNKKGYTVASSGEGSPGAETTYFGEGTKQALIRYQNDNKEAILTPVDLEEGTGYFGPSTIEHINEDTTPGTDREEILEQIATLLILIQQLQAQLEALQAAE